MEGSVMESLDELAEKLSYARGVEMSATNRRYEIEEKILSLVDVPENSTRTFHTSSYTITVKRASNYKADVDGLAKSGFKEMLEVVPKTYKFDPKAYEKLRTTDPERWNKATAFVTVKPCKAYITLKV